MLYKNLPRGRMRIVIGTRMVLDGLAALVYLLTGRRDEFSAVWRAHRDFRAMKNDGLREKRRVVQEGRAGWAENELREGRGDRAESGLREGRGGRTNGGGREDRIDRDGIRGRLRGVYRGSIVLRYLLGWRRFGKLL